MHLYRPEPRTEPRTSLSLVPAHATAPQTNHLLALLQHRSPEEFERISRHLESLVFRVGDVLFEQGEPIKWIFFPEGCVTSMIKMLSDGRGIEVGAAGIDGMAGFPSFLGADRMPTRCIIQVGGSGSRMSVEAFREESSAGSAMRDIVQRYAQYLFNQAVQSLACNRMHTLDQRCARWMLMTHDRIGDGDTFQLKHEFLALMLCVRRATVSVAAEALQRAGIIRYSRGKMTIVSRRGLEAASCECYHTGRTDYERLLGPAFSK
jgi:CRP-like cAMP-binding protein